MANKEQKTNKENKHFFKEFKAELKKVIWPTPKQLVNNTAVVVALVLMTALIVFVLDLCFDSVNKYGITRLQSMVQNSVTTKKDNSESHENVDNDSDDEENVTDNSENEEENSEEENNAEGTEENNQPTE